MAMIIMHLGTLLGILASLVPLVFTVAKGFPRLWAFIRSLWSAGRGRAATSTAGGIFLSLLAFLGGFGLVVFILYNFSFELYLGWLDFVLSPFAYLVKSLLSALVPSLPSSLPGPLLSVLGIFDYSKIFSILIFGWCAEFYLRLFIKFIGRVK